MLIQREQRNACVHVYVQCSCCTAEQQVSVSMAPGAAGLDWMSWLTASFITRSGRASMLPNTLITYEGAKWFHNVPSATTPGMLTGKALPQYTKPATLEVPDVGIVAQNMNTAEKCSRLQKQRKNLRDMYSRALFKCSGSHPSAEIGGRM